MARGQPRQNQPAQANQPAAVPAQTPPPPTIPPNVIIPADAIPPADRLVVPPEEPVDIPAIKTPSNGETIDLAPFDVVEMKDGDRYYGIMSTTGVALIVATGIGLIILPASTQGALITSLTIFLLLSVIFTIVKFTQTDAQKIKLYNNNLKSKTIVIIQSGYFIPHMWYSKYKPLPVVDLQVSGDISSTITVATKDNVPVMVDTTTNGKPSEKYIKNFILSAPGVVHQQVTGILADRLQKIFSLNNYRTLSSNRAEVFDYVARIFGGATVLTPAEKALGWIVVSQRSQQFRPEPGEGERMVKVLFEEELLPKIMEKVKGANPNLPDETILQTARRMLDKQIEEHRTVINASPNINTVGMGEVGVIAKK